MPATAVSFDLPYALYLSQGRIFEFPINGVLIKARLQDKRFTGETRHGRTQNMELLNDKAGTFRYSCLHLEFQTSQIQTREQLTELAHTAANRFIEVYRQVTGRSYLEPLRSFQINPNIRIQQPDGNWAGSMSVSFPHGLGPARRDDSPEIQSTVSSWLSSDRPIQLHDVLLLNAKDFLDREDYRSALMESSSAVEVCVEQFLRTAYRSWGWSEIRTAKYLESKHNWQISNRIKKLIAEVTGRRLASDPVWDPWYRAKRLRDKVVHAGLLLPHTDQDKATKAVTACEEMIKTVRSLPVAEEQKHDKWTSRLVQLFKRFISI